VHSLFLLEGEGEEKATKNKNKNIRDLVHSRISVGEPQDIHIVNV